MKVLLFYFLRFIKESLKNLHELTPTLEKRYEKLIFFSVEKMTTHNLFEIVDGETSISNTMKISSMLVCYFFVRSSLFKYGRNF